jgi:hypothetical protein
MIHKPEFNLMETFTRKQISDITKIPDRRVLFYSEQNILPGFKKAVGRGKARIYSVKDLFYLLLMKELDALGLSLSKIRGLILLLEVWTTMGKLRLWVNGKFTDEPVTLVIAPMPDIHGLDPTSKNYGEEFNVQIVKGLEVKIPVDGPSRIVVNLNRVFKKAGV